MTLLLDTHALLWFLAADPLLAACARAAIEDRSQRKLVSVATCWEIAIKVGLKKLDLGEPASTFLPRELSALGLGGGVDSQRHGRTYMCGATIMIGWRPCLR
jgi:PIN domain nuclease of toxin-antitoxin system